MKSQSAMEYLMTYGWAILIIAIVLAALFELGVFNSANFSPKATPGGCQIFRPQGPGSTFDINLEGECNGELPEYVGGFGGAVSNILVPDTNSIQLSSQGSINVWVDLASYYPTSEQYQLIVNKGNWGANANDISIYPASSTQLRFAIYGASAASEVITISPPVLVAGTWYDLAFTWNSVKATAYIDGRAVGSESLTSLPNTIGYPLIFGQANMYTYEASYNGLVSNVQFYNTTMSANDVQTLYDAGIGGAPIDIASLVGWWPLNGNAQDYSGNLNNGVPSNMVYTGAWASGYTQP